VLDAAGIPAPPGLGGVSLLGADPRTRPLISETERRGGVRCLVEGPYKLIEYLEAGEVELFDRSTDPLEAHDLAGEDPERTARMQAALEDWAAGIERTSATRIELDAEERSRLEQLGYTE